MTILVSTKRPASLAADAPTPIIDSSLTRSSRRHLLSALACGAALPLLAACGSRPAGPRLLDLGPTPAWNTPVRLARRVEIQAVSASELLQGTSVVYRLDYADPYVRRAYRDSRWAAPVPTLVAGRLKQLASRADLVAGADTAAPASLLVELDDCVQRFSSATQSEVTLRLSASIVTSGVGRGAVVGARKTFEGSGPAGGDADGAVRAVAAVLDRIGVEMLVWAAAVNNAPPKT